MTDKTQTTYVHINRGAGVHYVVAGIMRGCRKTTPIAKSRSKTVAIRKAAEKGETAMTDKPKTTKRGIIFFIRMLLISTLLDLALRLMPDGTKGRVETALASIVFHKGLLP